MFKGQLYFLLAVLITFIQSNLASLQQVKGRQPPQPVVYPTPSPQPAIVFQGNNAGGRTMPTGQIMATGQTMPTGQIMAEYPPQQQFTVYPTSSPQRNQLAQPFQPYNPPGTPTGQVMSGSSGFFVQPFDQRNNQPYDQQMNELLYCQQMKQLYDQRINELLYYQQMKQLNDQRQNELYYQQNNQGFGQKTGQTLAPPYGKLHVPPYVAFDSSNINTTSHLEYDPLGMRATHPLYDTVFSAGPVNK